MKTIIRKRLFCILLACCFLQLCLPLQQIGGFVTTAFAAEEENVYDFAGGTGTAENPYKVETMFHLNNVRHYLDAHFIQMNDIDLTEATADNGILGAWQSIGTFISTFNGNYDGDGNAIKGLQGESLFGSIGKKGLVQNLGMVDGNVTATAITTSSSSIYTTSYFGSIAGRNAGTISNCYNTGNITPTSSIYTTSYSGGIAGENDGTISNCYNTGNVTPVSPLVSYSGGIAGRNDGTISNCYNTGDVTPVSSGNARSYSGGIAGENERRISNCYNTGNVTSSDSSGGIAAYNDGTISNCYNTGSVTSSDSSGGIAGWNDGTISNCYNTGNVTSSSSSDSSGGIAGYNDGTISNCYNTGNVTAAFSKYSGGIAGENAGTISNCYNTGSVTSSASSGGIAGRNDEPYSMIENCYTVDEIHLNDYGTKLTVGQMKQQDYFTGFDFNSVWTYDTASGYPFPVLKNIKHIERQENTTDFHGGNGTFYNPYLVATEQQLDAVRNHLHDCFMQVADIDLTEETSEGGIFYHNGNGWTAFDTFTGNYNGNTHTITGLKTKGDGLFDSNKGIIKNLGMVDGNVTSSYSGGIVGRNGGTISNCYNTGNVTSSSYSGGIAGRNGGTISNCYNTGNVTATTNFASSSTVTSYSGGIAGYNDGTISNCYSTGNVATTATTISPSISVSSHSGGIVGRNAGIISNCYNTGNVIATATTTSISSTATITSYSGGIAGWNGETISNCYNTGNVTATTISPSVSTISYSGGIVGKDEGAISNCYNTGTVNATSKNNTAYAGGLVGNSSGTSATISTSYSMGEVSATGATTRVGKVIGMNEGATLSRLYYIDTLSDMGIGNEKDGQGRVEFRTAEQMKTPSSLTGFDFDTIWAVDETINNGFPYLQGVGVVAPPIEQPKNELERSIDNLFYDSDKQVYTFTIALENTTDNAITTNVFAAAYDDSGRMTGLAIYDLTDLAAGSGTAIDAVIPAPQTAAYIKVICMDSNTLAPVGMALKEEM